MHDDHGELRARAIIGSTYLSIAIDIVGKYPTAVIRGYYRPAPDLSASTPLKLSVDPSFQGKAAESWRDDEDGKLESKIASIAAGIIVAGEAAFRRGLREAVERAKRQRQLEEKARQEHLAAIEAKRLEHLRQSGELLRQAEDIRALVARVKTAILAGEKVIQPDELDAWEARALDYADRLDPVKSGQIMTHLKTP